MHVPQLATLRAPPQLSVPVRAPQVAVCLEQNSASVSGLQPQVRGVVPPPQVWGLVQVPQLATDRTTLQRSVTVTGPQLALRVEHKAASVSPVQPQTLAVPPPPHVRSPPQVVDLVTVLLTPQLSGAVTTPQFFPSRSKKAASVSGAQAHTFGDPPPPQVCVPLQLPQLTELRHVPQLSCPEVGPQFFPSRAQKAVLSSAVQPQRLGVPPPPQV